MYVKDRRGRKLLEHRVTLHLQYFLWQELFCSYADDFRCDS